MTVIELHRDSAQTKPYHTLKINLSDGSAVFDGMSDKKLKVSWYISKLVFAGVPKGADTFDIDCGTASSGFYRNIDGGVTVLKYPIGSQWGIFPVYEKFYLKGLE